MEKYKLENITVQPINHQQTGAWCVEIIVKQIIKHYKKLPYKPFNKLPYKPICETMYKNGSKR